MTITDHEDAKELESKKEWKNLLLRATKHDAWRAILQVSDLARGLSQTDKKSARRLQKYADLGEKIYEKRFNEIWLPF